MNHAIETIMQDSAIRKAFAKRVKALRKQHHWTQKELANRIGSSYQQLNKYECGLHTPPLDKLLLLAEALGTTVDYLITGNPNENVPIHHTGLLQRFRELERFGKEDQDTVIRVIDAVIAKRRVENALQPVSQTTSG